MVLFVWLLPPALALDQNGDGMDDLWQQRYGIAAFAGHADPDGDGRTRLEESIVGTNPCVVDSLQQMLADNPGLPTDPAAPAGGAG